MKKKHLLSRILCSGIVSAVLTIAVFFFVHSKNHFMQLVVMAAVFALSFIIGVIPKFRIKRYVFSLISIIAAAGMLSGMLYGIHACYKNVSEYRSPDPGSEMYRDKSVLIVVPHQDDEINIASGVTELFVKNGSDVTLVFTTAGDDFNLGEVRMRESLKAAEYYGIPEKNVVFLGYGSELKDDAPAMYNSAPDMVVKSHIGKNATYGLPEHPAYNEGTLYTSNNMKNDLKKLVLEIRPDIVFSIDCDFHSDHRTASLLLEKAFSELLADGGNYHPLLFKAFAYAPSYYAEDDYYSKNMISSKIKCEYDLVPGINAYKWSERVRFPVSSQTLSRYLTNSSTYKAMELYPSQYLTQKAEGIINGDKIFWQRNTNSLLYTADVKASSCGEEILNDFRIFDFDDVFDPNAEPFDGAWIPADNDTAKKVTFTLKNSTPLSEIWLYDNPSTVDNVLNAVITFDDGTKIETGKLEKNGSATKVVFELRTVKSFSVAITATEGKSAGFTEIEAYNGTQNDNNFVKIMKIINGRDDFVYDYYIDRSGTEEFSLYRYNCTDVEDSAYEISCSNDSCKAVINGGRLTVTCPEGESTQLTVSDVENGVSDTVVISNPRDARIRSLARYIDKQYNRSFSLQGQIDYYYEMKVYVFAKIFGQTRQS